jgi:two-component system NarL family response regulator
LEAFEKTMQLRPDIILMDIRMPVCDGISATRMIKAERPECKIVILTTSTDEPDLLEAIKSGANGYLLKSLETGPFLTYLEGVERGEAAISRELSGILLKAIARNDEEVRRWGDTQTINHRDAELTPHQVKILQLVAQGLSNKELAERLCLSEHTIKYHLGEIFRRLHLKNREQAVNYAVSKGLVK